MASFDYDVLIIGSEFGITTGAVLSGPATRPLNVYETQDVDGAVQIRVVSNPPLERKLS